MIWIVKDIFNHLIIIIEICKIHVLPDVVDEHVDLYKIVLGI